MLLLALALTAGGAAALAEPSPAAAVGGSTTTPTAPARQDQMVVGEQLVRGQRLVSGYLGLASLDLGTDGRLVVNRSSTWLESADSTLLGVGVDALVMQADGNLVGYRADGGVAYQSRTAGSGAAKVAILDTGALTLYLAGGADLASPVPGRSTSSLAVGQALYTGESLRSGDTELVLDNVGQLYVRVGWRERWRLGIGGGSTLGLVLQRDGNLVLYRHAGDGVAVPVWQSGTAGATAGGAEVRAVLDEDGLTLLRSTRLTPPVQIWSTSWAEPTLAPLGRMEAGERRTSPSGRCSLRLQGDGNLVHYCDGRALLATGTHGWDGGHVLVAQSDGNVVLYRVSGRPGWWTATRTPGAYLTVQDDTNLVVYAPGGRPLWSRLTGPLA